MKKIVKIMCLVLCVAIVSVSFAGCGNKNTSSTKHTGSGTVSDPYVLKFSGEDAEGIASTEGMHWIADQVKKRTGGTVVLKVYPGAMLGDANLEYQGIMDGSIDMCMFYFNSTYDKVFDIAAIPFLTSNYDEIAYMVSDKSNMYKLYKQHCNKIGVKFVSFFMNGVNGMFSTKDFGDYTNINKKKRLLIRIANSRTYSIGIAALGYNTITIPWSDTYTSMQTGVMDGMTGIPSYMVVQNFADLAKYYVATNEFMESKCVLMAPATAKWLPKKDVDIIQDVCNEASQKSVKETKTNVLKGEQDLKKLGVKIMPLSDQQRTVLAAQVQKKIQPQLKSYFGDSIMKQVNEDIINAKAYAASKNK